MESKPLIERMHSVFNLIREVLEYIDRRRFKCVGGCGIHNQCAMPAIMNTKGNGN